MIKIMAVNSRASVESSFDGYCEGSRIKHILTGIGVRSRMALDDSTLAEVCMGRASKCFAAMQVSTYPYVRLDAHRDDFADRLCQVAIGYCKIYAASGDR